jgi:hypothetical protein
MRLQGLFEVEGSWLVYFDFGKPILSLNGAAIFKRQAYI